MIHINFIKFLNNYHYLNFYIYSLRLIPLFLELFLLFNIKVIFLGVLYFVVFAEKFLFNLRNKEDILKDNKDEIILLIK